jgi:hypothetical protein
LFYTPPKLLLIDERRYLLFEPCSAHRVLSERAVAAVDNVHAVHDVQVLETALRPSVPFRVSDGVPSAI